MTPFSTYVVFYLTKVKAIHPQLGPTSHENYAAQLRLSPFETLISPFGADFSEGKQETTSKTFGLLLQKENIEIFCCWIGRAPG